MIATFDFSFVGENVGANVRSDEEGVDVAIGERDGEVLHFAVGWEEGEVGPPLTFLGFVISFVEEVGQKWEEIVVCRAFDGIEDVGLDQFG